MKFLIHYIVKTSLAPLHFDTITSDPITADNLNHLRTSLARRASTKSGDVTGTKFAADEITIAGIFPIPDGEPIPHGGS